MRKDKKGNKQKLITIKVFYDKELSLIAGKKEEALSVHKGITSADFIKLLISKYPKIKKKYGSDELSFERNDTVPQEKDVLKHNDTFVFSTWTMQETREEIKEMLGFVINHFSMPYTVDDTLQLIFEEESGDKERNFLLKAYIEHVHEPELIPIVYRLVNHAWLFFPHHYLNGKSPVELMQKVVKTRLG